jgi:hypothetical protein
MSRDDRIEAALKRRPADERDYDEILRAGASSAARRVRSHLPALLAICLVLVFGAAAATALLVRPASPGASVNPSAATPGPTLPAPSPSSLLIGCWGYQPGFPPATLEGTGTAENEDSPASEVLRLVLQDSSAAGFPKTGWHEVVSTEDLVEFVAQEGSDLAYFNVIVQRGSAGQLAAGGWSASGWGGCKLEALPAAGFGTASWTLDPAASLTPDSTEIPILVTEESCAGGRTPPAGSIRADVTYEDAGVLVTISVLSPEGGVYTCQANPPAPYVVHLDQPLGNRALLDGGTWPAVSVAGAPESAGSPSAGPGDTPGPWTPGPTDTPGASPTFIIYTIRHGDTLSKIAAQFNVPLSSLLAANPLITNSNQIIVGQKIFIPWPGWVPPSPDP